MVAKGFCWGFCRRVVKRRWMKGSESKEYREKKMGMVSLQRPVPLDTLDTQHMSSLGHVSRTQRVQWPLATGLKLKQLDLYFCFFYCVLNCLIYEIYLKNWLPDEENELHRTVVQGQAQPNLIPPQTGDRWGEIKGRQSEELRTSEEFIFLRKTKWW